MANEGWVIKTRHATTAKCQRPLMAHHHRILFLFALYLICANAYSIDSDSQATCCTRHKKLIQIGYGVNSDEYYVDVGQCRHYCNSEDSSVERVRSCEHGYSCYPSVLRREMHSVLGGSEEVHVVVSCACYEKSNGCERQSKWLRLFDDSPLQVDIDVGVCRGSCSSVHGEFCQPTRNKTESVTGPNGAVCVEVIEECACTPLCYRMHRTSVYFDVSWNATDANATGEQNLITKEIDVGLCVGVCTSDQGHLCVLSIAFGASLGALECVLLQTAMLPTPSWRRQTDLP